MLLHEPFDFHAGSRGRSIIARTPDAHWSYAEAQERSVRMASALHDLGLRSGDRVATIMANSLDALLLIFAAARSGLVCVPLNYRLSPREWIGMIEDAEARIVVADPGHAEALQRAGGKPSIGICAHGSAPGWLDLDTLVAMAASRTAPCPARADMPVLQLYTSGTTGKPKGAMLTHASILSNIGQISFVQGGIVTGQVSLHVLPFFHVAGVVFALRAILGGETLVVAREVDPRAILHTLVQERIAWAMLVPALIQMLLDQPEIEGMAFPHLRYLFYGASPIAARTLVGAMRAFKCGFLQGFGMTELSCAATILTEADHEAALAGKPHLLSSAGRALPGTELRVVEAGGADCPPGGIGEILVRGPQVFAGYAKMPEATAAAVTDGWLRTGDVGSVDADGYLFIRDRIKDMILSGGENVYPAEVEAVLHAHPDVADVAVIGVPDDKWGETVMAVVVLRAGCMPDEAAFERHCRANLGGFKIPRRYSFVAQLPRNASGKILKRELRARYWPAGSPTIG